MISNYFRFKSTKIAIKNLRLSHSKKYKIPQLYSADKRYTLNIITT